MISVIIATFNRAALLAETLEALSGQQLPPGGFEVVVADNGSTDGTADVVRAAAARLPVVYLRVDTPGKSHAVNAAIERATGDLLVFTDDDVLPSPGWLAAWVQAFEETGADYGAGRVLPRWEIPPPPWMSSALYGVLALPDSGPERLVGEQLRDRGVMTIGANMAVRRSALERIGGWRTDLGKLRGTLRTGEDHEFYLRLVAAGCRGVYEPAAVVRHFVPASRLQRSYFREWFAGNGATVAQLEAEYPTSPHRWLGVPRYLWREAATHMWRLLRASVAFDAPSRFAAAVRLLWFLGFVREAWSHRPRGWARATPSGQVR